MSNPDNTSSFYPPSSDEVDFEEPASEITAHEIFLRDISHLTDRGPFLSDEKRIALRAFSHKDVTLFGFLIEETSDSFIVVLPASLARDEKGVNATQIIASPTARLLKTSVGIMSLPTPVQTLYYLSLVAKQFKTCPGYFTEARIQHLTNLVSLLKIALGVAETEPKKPVKPKTEGSITKENFQVPDSLIPRITH